MKLTLKELQEARTLRNTIATIKTQIEYILWLLSNTTSNTSAVAQDEYHYEATTKAGLQDASTVPAGSLGRVKGVDGDNGMMCIVNETEDGWVAINVLE